MLPHTSNNHTSKDILLTGLNEFLGKSVLEELLIKFPTSRIFCLLDSKTQKLSCEKLIDNCAYKNVKLLDGNTSKEHLGLCKEDYMFCVESINCIVHCEDASFKSKINSIQSNIHILDLIRNIEQLGNKKPAFLFVSAALPNILENKEVENDASFKFRNKYEEDKYTIEKLIKSYENHCHYFIVRPSTILAKHSGEYDLGDENIQALIDVNKENHSLINVLSRDALYDFVTVEYVAKNIVDILSNAKTIPSSTIFNITDHKGGLTHTHAVEILNTMFKISLKDESRNKEKNTQYSCENIQKYVYENDILTLNSSEILRRVCQHYLDKQKN